MDKLLEQHKLTQKETDNWNRSITSKETDLVMQKLRTKKKLGHGAFSVESYQTLNTNPSPNSSEKYN